MLTISRIELEKGYLPHSEATDEAQFESLICNSTWSPILWKEQRRAEATFQGSYFLVYDIDEALSLEAAITRLKSSGLYCLIGLSRNHGKEKNGKTNDRFRVIFKLSSFLTDWADYRHSWENYRELYLPEADPKAGLATQVFYPCTQIVFKQEGSALVGRKAPQPTLDRLVEMGQTTQPDDEKEARHRLREAGVKGRLGRRSLEFLTLGAPDGEWNVKLRDAARDAMEQNYSQEEFIELAARITGHLDQQDLKTIEKQYTYAPGNELRTDAEKLDAAEKTFNFFDDLKDTEKFLINPINTDGWSTGFAELDRRLGGGLLPHYFTGLTSEGKVGKSTLLTMLCFNLARHGLKVGFASLEMKPKQHIMPSLLSIAYQLNIRKIPKENVSELLRAAPKQFPFLNNISFYNHYGTCRVEALAGWIEYQYEATGTKVFFVDHNMLALDDPADLKGHGHFAKTLKAVCNELPIHLIAVLQSKNLSEFGGRRERPSKQTIFGGAQYGMHVNNVITLERDRQNPNYSKLYLTDSHSPTAITSTEDPVILRYDYKSCTLTE